ncbi:MAG: hypothetical protein C5B48_07720 [Candidatus Rokuibacteriota bacterium]|nr:MAG: hypothetical protein C5B48_07720 [Candidatus Rokubacteria bacterium]
MPSRRRILVLHLAGQYPLAGIGWQAVHYAVGLARLGHDVYYVEDSGAPPYDPRIRSIAEEPSYSVEFLGRTMARVGLADRWVYVDTANDRHYGLARDRLHRLYRESDALVNLCGAARLSEAHMRCPVRIYLQTDPVHDQILLAENNPITRAILATHTHHFTYGENLGSADCPIPLRDFHWRPTRPPVVLDLWEPRFDARATCFTTVGTWRNVDKDVRFAGETYFWSKHVNFLRFMELPRLTSQPLELALEIDDRATRRQFREHGWRLKDAYEISRNLDAYQRHIYGSRGEFTVAKDLVARTRSGWFSDRSVCYLAAGKPVVTQETGFSKFVPTGRGLHAFSTLDEAAAAIEEINGDYADQCRAARDIAAQYFGSQQVLGELCREADL